jgi:hypothetical protein
MRMSGTAILQPGTLDVLTSFLAVFQPILKVLKVLTVLT